MGLTTFVAGFSTYLTRGGANQFSERLTELNSNVTDLINGRAEELATLTEALESAEDELRGRIGEGTQELGVSKSRRSSA